MNIIGKYVFFNLTIFLRLWGKDGANTSNYEPSQKINKMKNAKTFDENKSVDNSIGPAFFNLYENELHSCSKDAIIVEVNFKCKCALQLLIAFLIYFCS